MARRFDIEGLRVFSLFDYSIYRDFYISFKYFKNDNGIFKKVIQDYSLDILIDDFIILPINKSYHVDILVRLVSNKFQAPYFYSFNYVKRVDKNCQLDSVQRFLNVANSLKVVSIPEGFYYVLFDDIVTTGATLLEMRRALLDYGISADQICGLTFFSSKY